MQFTNGNSLISFSNDGTRTIEYEDKLELDQPLNIDIRVSTSCSFAETVCKGFCHESALKNGIDCDFSKLKEKLECIGPGIELAIGCNRLTEDLIDFLKWAKGCDYICSITINQGHVQRDLDNIRHCIQNDYIKGLGISYRASLKWGVPTDILNYTNTVVHVIMGLDTLDNVATLSARGVRKILILGEKDFGFNAHKVDLNSPAHKQWNWHLPRLFSLFDVVSFDNLAVEQLDLKRLVKGEMWNRVYNGEHSMYIDAAQEFYAQSSRSSNRVNWDQLSIKGYWNTIQERACV